MDDVDDEELPTGWRLLLFFIWRPPSVPLRERPLRWCLDVLRNNMLLLCALTFAPRIAHALAVPCDCGPLIGLEGVGDAYNDGSPRVPWWGDGVVVLHAAPLPPGADAAATIAMARDATSATCADPGVLLSHDGRARYTRATEAAVAIGGGLGAPPATIIVVGSLAELSAVALQYECDRRPLPPDLVYRLSRSDDAHRRAGDAAHAVREYLIETATPPAAVVPTAPTAVFVVTKEPAVRRATALLHLRMERELATGGAAALPPIVVLPLPSEDLGLEWGTLPLLAQCATPIDWKRNSSRAAAPSVPAGAHNPLSGLFPAAVHHTAHCIACLARVVAGYAAEVAATPRVLRWVGEALQLAWLVIDNAAVPVEWTCDAPVPIASNGTTTGV